MRYPLLGGVLVLTVIALPVGVCAQETIFNVPSADVLEAGKGYLEIDQYFRPWETDSGRAAFFFLRGVVGVGLQVGFGVNTGPFDTSTKANRSSSCLRSGRPSCLESGW